MLGPAGRAAVLQALAGEGAAIVVSDGKQVARADVTGASTGDQAVTFTATFGETEANFEWTARTVVDAQGGVIDAEEIDMGRKAPGSAWTIEAVIEIPQEAS